MKIVFTDTRGILFVAEFFFFLQNKSLILLKL